MNERDYRRLRLAQAWIDGASTERQLVKAKRVFDKVLVKITNKGGNTLPATAKASIR